MSKDELIAELEQAIGSLGDEMEDVRESLGSLCPRHFSFGGVVAAQRALQAALEFLREN